MYFLFKIFLLLIVTRLSAKKVVSDNEEQDTNGRKDKNMYNKVARRFLDDLDDAEWHISHLKDTHFGLKSDCSGETFDDTVKKYRDSLRKDGALVEFVSANALPFNVSDSLKVCKVPAKKKTTSKVTHSPIDAPEAVITQQPEPTVNVEKKTIKEENKATEDMENLNVATTTTEKSGKKRGAKEKHRRASEYVFSSVEYYDEEPLVSEALCPDELEIIDLEIEVIRNYDLRCEQILLWKSLE